jgi:uncharacterized membrane protein
MSRTVPTPHDAGLATLFALPAKGAAKKKPPPVLTLRLSPEDRARLERDAAGASLSACARSRLFDDARPVKRRAGPASVQDREALTRALALLGRSGEVAALKALAKSVRQGDVQLSPQTEAALMDACATIEAIRRDLIAALGLKPE